MKTHFRVSGALVQTCCVPPLSSTSMFYAVVVGVCVNVCTGLCVCVSECVSVFPCGVCVYV